MPWTDLSQPSNHACLLACAYICRYIAPSYMRRWNIHSKRWNTRDVSAFNRARVHWTRHYFVLFVCYVLLSHRVVSYRVVSRRIASCRRPTCLLHLHSTHVLFSESYAPKLRGIIALSDARSRTCVYDAPLAWLHLQIRASLGFETRPRIYRSRLNQMESISAA